MYMLYVENRNSPTIFHNTYESALAEARRLCKKTESKVYILRAVKTVELNLFTETNLVNDLPF